MSPEEYNSYFETVATHNKALGHVVGDESQKHFYKADIIELLGDLRSRFKNHALILEHAEDSPIDNVSDNEMVSQDCGFLVVATVSGRTNLKEVNEKREFCYRVAWQIISKLRNDYRKGIFFGFQYNTCHVTAWYNEDSTLVGSRVTFKYEDIAPIEFDSTQWTNETAAIF